MTASTTNCPFPTCAVRGIQMTEIQSRRGSGYVTDTVFQTQYIATQRPALLQYVAAQAGYEFGNHDAPYRYLELGCGTGWTINCFAAANPHASFVGVDFNEQHIDVARRDAEKFQNANAAFVHASFDEFVEDATEPFDFIATHGTYSWLAEPVRSAVHRVFAEMSLPGTILYLNYMVLPGKSAISPVWHLMRQLTRGRNDESSIERARHGLGYLKSLIAENTGYLKDHPYEREVVQDAIARAEGDDEGYRHIAHHALSEVWQPYFAAEILEEMRALGYNYAGSTRLTRNDPDLCLPIELAWIYGKEFGPEDIEGIKDFYFNQQERHDVFVRPQGRDSRTLNETHYVIMRPGEHLAPKIVAAGDRQITFENDLDQRILSSIRDGATTADAIRRHQQLASCEPHAVDDCLSKLVAGNALRMFPSAPRPMEFGPFENLSPASHFNREQFNRQPDGEPLFEIAMPRFGGCLTFHPLTCNLVAVALKHGTSDLAFSDVAACIRERQGKYRISGRELSASALPDNLIENFWEQATRFVMPNLVRFGAIEGTPID